MKNFKWTIDTKLLFGKDQEVNFAKEIKEIANTVLVVTGKGAVKRAGIFDKVVNELKNEGITILEFEGIDPNPRNTSVVEGAKICKENNVDLILGIGGGSVIDCIKAMSLQAVVDFDVWEECYVNHKQFPEVQSLPIATVLTISATGSEMNCGSVISNIEQNKKYAYGRTDWRPRVSLLNPEFTYSVSKWQTAAGSVDILSHLIDQYFSNANDFIQNRVIEGIAKTIIKYSLECLENPEDYNARSQFMWAGTLALNDLTSLGKEATDWSCHQIEHQLSAFYDITHGIGLAIVTPNWIKNVVSEDNAWQFAEFARNVFGVTETDDMKATQELINELNAWFKKLDIPTTLTEVEIDATHFEEMAEDAVRHASFGAMKKMTKEDVLNILNDSL